MATVTKADDAPQSSFRDAGKVWPSRFGRRRLDARQGLPLWAVTYFALAKRNDGVNGATSSALE